MTTVFKLIIPFALIAFRGQCQDVEWSETKKLTFEDFKAEPDPLRPKAYLILALGCEAHLKSDEVQHLEKFNSQVTSVFLPGQSWIAKESKISLRYANILFDLNEWMSREVRKRLNENKSKVLEGDGESIYQDVRKEFENYRRAVGAETEGGENEIGIMTWQTRIQERLISLADYCKKCK